MRSPFVRNAVSRIRWRSVSRDQAISSKISGSGANVILVPVWSVKPAALMSASGTPRAKSWRYTFPSRSTVASSRSDSAFTTDTPTPWRPPETL